MHVALLLLALVQRQQIDLPTEMSSKHYDLRTNATKEQAKELLEFMDIVWTTYAALLKPDDPATLERRSTMLLYKNAADYHAAGGPPSAGAHYSLNSKELVGYYDPVFMRVFMAHEGMHQFTDLTSKNFRDFPMWFSEGIADCIGNSEVRNGKLYMCVKSGMISRMRLPLIQQAIREGKNLLLHRLMRLSQPEFMAPDVQGLAYAQSWSFCHFLMTYPQEEDRSRQIPNGKFRRNLAIYYETVRTGGSGHDKAWKAAFPEPDLAELEKLWKAYVLELDAGRFLGFNGADITATQADALKLPSSQGGIRVDTVSETGVAKTAGLQPGDIIVSFDGNAIPRKDGMGRLRIWMQSVRDGEPVKVKVLREGKTVELTAVWRAPEKK
jgi:uncharacterized protein DUF1570/PDZ domain-containing protein